MPKFFSPRTANTAMLNPMMTSEPMMHARAFDMKSKRGFSKKCIIVRFFTPKRSVAHANPLRVTINAENSDATMPRVSDTANPFTGPAASMNRIVLVMSVVTFASKMDENALLYAPSMAGRSDLPDASSSRNRSKTSTLASMARPMVRMTPAMPGRVSTKLKLAIMPKSRTMLMTSAMLASTPAKR